MEKLYKAQEAAEYLGKSLATIWRYVRLGKLEPIHPGPAHLRFSETELRRFIMDGQKARSKAKPCQEKRVK